MSDSEYFTRIFGTWCKYHAVWGSTGRRIRSNLATFVKHADDDELYELAGALADELMARAEARRQQLALLIVAAWFTP